MSNEEQHDGRSDSTAEQRSSVSGGNATVFPADEERPGVAYSVNRPSDRTPTFRQPNSVTFEAYFWSAGVTAGWRTVDGYTILKGDDNYWYYATRGDGQLVPSDARVGIDQAPVWVPTELTPSTPSGGTQAAAGATTDNAHTHKATVGVDTLPSTGNQSIPLVMINFTDTPTSYSPAEFQSLLFGDDPNIATGPGSVTDYYEEISSGQLTLTGNVSGWETADNSQSYYGSGGIGDGGAPTGAAELVKEAAQKADDQVDFAKYDNDGDCVVDQFAVTHQGGGQETTDKTEDIWSHRWFLSAGTGSRYASTDSSPSCPTIYVDGYTIQPETDDGQMATIGVYAHEFGHGLGLPDLYDTDYSSAGIGNWGLMGTGSHGGVTRSGDAPNHMTAWSKAYLGWLNPLEVTAGETRDDVTLRNVSKNTDYLKLLNETNNTNGEYFYIGNRQKVGFDRGLPGEGLLITHINESRLSDGCLFLNTCNDDEDTKLVDVEAADGREDMDKNRNRGDAVDPWWEAVSPFDDDSDPSSTYDTGTSSNATVSEIRFLDGTTQGAATVDAFVRAFSVGIDATNTPVVEGETLSVDTVVENTGRTRDTQAVTLDVGSLGSNSTTVTLDGGESANISLSVTTSDGATGTYAATVSSEDSSDSTGVRVLAEEYFAVGVNATNAPVAAGETLSVDAVVENTGEVQDTQTITLDVGALGTNSTTVTLSGGESRNVSLSVTAGDAGSYMATVSSEDSSDSAGVEVFVDGFAVRINTTNAPVAAGETLSVNAAVQNTGDTQETQTVALDAGALGTANTTLTLGEGESDTVTLSVATGSDDAWGYTTMVSSANDSDSGNVTVVPIAGNDVGDVDGDGEVNIVDVVRIQRHLAEIDPGPFSPVLADVERDGGVDIVDAVRIQRLLAELDDPGEAIVVGFDAPDSVVAGDPLAVSATVENPGDHGTLQAVEFRLASNDPEANATEAVDLTSGESTGLPVVINTTGLDPGNYTLSIVTKDDTEQTTVTITSDPDAATSTRSAGSR